MFVYLKNKAIFATAIAKRFTRFGGDTQAANEDGL
jgi:hypothetical protein